MVWTNEPQPFGKNHAPLLAGVSSIDGVTPVPIAVDPTTGAILNSTASGYDTVVGIGPVGQNRVAYDTVSYTNTSSTVDTYVYKAGGAGGTTTATITITFTDTTKTQVSTVVRT